VVFLRGDYLDKTNRIQSITRMQKRRRNLFWSNNKKMQEANPMNPASFLLCPIYLDGTKKESLNLLEGSLVSGNLAKTANQNNHAVKTIESKKNNSVFSPPKKNSHLLSKKKYQIN
jgi:hypothetical protein